MDTRIVFAGAVFIIVLLIVIITWTTYPVAMYVKLVRGDGQSKFIAVQDIEVFDNNHNKREIASVTGGVTKLWGDDTTAKAANTDTLFTTGPIVVDGTTKGYTLDMAASATVPSLVDNNSVGPVVAFLTSSNATTGSLVFKLSCPGKISQVNIRSTDNNTAMKNMQGVKVLLLDKNKDLIKGAEQLIPFTISTPNSVHKIKFV